LAKAAYCYFIPLAKANGNEAKSLPSHLWADKFEKYQRL